MNHKFNYVFELNVFICVMAMALMEITISWINKMFLRFLDPRRSKYSGKCSFHYLSTYFWGHNSQISPCSGFLGQIMFLFCLCPSFHYSHSFIPSTERRYLSCLCTLSPLSRILPYQVAVIWFRKGGMEWSCHPDCFTWQVELGFCDQVFGTKIASFLKFVRKS